MLKLSKPPTFNECGIRSADFACLPQAGNLIPRSTLRIPKLFDSLNINFDKRKKEGDDQWTRHQSNQSKNLDPS